MAILNGLNIRKGLEFEEVTISDIFHPKTAPEGESIIQEIYEKGWDKFIEENPDKNIENVFNKEEGIIYLTEKKYYKVSETLTAYISDCYLAYIDDAHQRVVSEKHTEIDFINTEMLTFRDFCRNIMEAQAFSGTFEESDVKYSFAGIGDFTMAQYAELHNLVVFSKMHTLDFFIFYKGVLSSIGFFLSGLYENDIKQQSEYLKEEEAILLIKECRKHRRFVAKKIAELGADFEDER